MKSNNFFQSIWALENFLVLDTETTGLSGDDEILQLGIIDKKGRVVFDQLIRPGGKREWPGAQRVHGITPEMVADCFPLSHFDELFEILNGQTVLVYNAPYDSRIFRQSLAICGCDWYPEIKWVDAMQPYAEHWGAWSNWHQSYTWQSLTNACAQQGVEVREDAHSAVADCLMTLALIEKLATAE
jgi:DNA polymerase-3 subunit epsilon